MDRETLETAERLEAIVESAVDGIISMDEGGTIESVNQAATDIFGYDRDEMIGAPVTMLMPSPYREEHDEYLARYLKKGIRRIIGYGREVSGRRKDGQAFPLYLAVSEGSHREARVFTGILRDLSDLRRAEERARSAEQLASLSLLTAGIAHDIGTPMNVILGYADMLKDSLSEEKDRRRAEIISEQVRRVTNLIETLLNIARPHEMIRAPLLAKEVLDHALDFFREKLRSRGIEVDRHYADPGEILGDKDRLEQTFLNLIVNAADAMSGGGRLAVSVTVADDDWVEVAIEDTGEGIAPEMLERIFEPFQTTKDRGQGTGLGLVVCRSIVLAHHGTIAVESEAGKGTRFLLRFPPRALADALHRQG
ncbi:MAG: ATP-binding protein [Myxococcota bacterium]